MINGVDTRIATQEVTEWIVAPQETSHTHIVHNWKGWLPANQRLRVELDMWNVPDANPMRIVGGTVRGFYGRPDTGSTLPPPESGMWTTATGVKQLGDRRPTRADVRDN